MRAIESDIPANVASRWVNGLTGSAGLTGAFLPRGSCVIRWPLVWRRRKADGLDLPCNLNHDEGRSRLARRDDRSTAGSLRTERQGRARRRIEKEASLAFTSRSRTSDEQGSKRTLPPSCAYFSALKQLPVDFFGDLIAEVQTKSWTRAGGACW